MIFWRYPFCTRLCRFLKVGIQLRHRQTVVWHSSLSSASVDSATNWATCHRGCCNPSNQLSVDWSETSQRNSPPHAQYGQNMPRLAEVEKHSLVRGVAHRGCHATPPLPSACLCLWCIPSFTDPTFSHNWHGALWHFYYRIRWH